MADKLWCLQSVTNFALLQACKMGNFFYLKILVGCAEALKRILKAIVVH